MIRPDLVTVDGKTLVECNLCRMWTEKDGANSVCHECETHRPGTLVTVDGETRVKCQCCQTTRVWTEKDDANSKCHECEECVFAWACSFCKSMFFVYFYYADDPPLPDVKCCECECTEVERDQETESSDSSWSGSMEEETL